MTDREKVLAIIAELQDETKPTIRGVVWALTDLETTCADDFVMLEVAKLMKVLRISMPRVASDLRGGRLDWSMLARLGGNMPFEVLLKVAQEFELVSRRKATNEDVAQLIGELAGFADKFTQERLAV